MVITYGDMKFLIDPWLQDKGTGRSAPSPDPMKNKIGCPIMKLPCSVEELLKGIDACLVTHVHPDHFTEEYLPKDMLYILKNRKDEKTLHDMGFLNTKCFEQNELIFGNVSLTRTEGKHGVHTVCAKAMGNVCGYIFKCPTERTLYLAGDTVYYEKVDEVITSEQPEVIILNACDARIKILGRLIMNIEDVLKVRKQLPNAKIIISHMDNVNHAFLTRTDYYNLKAETKDENLFIPEDGESIQL